MSSIRCILVDDEPLARVHLRALLADEPDVEIVGEASSIVGALEIIRTAQPDLVFLDIELRNSTGFDLLEQMDPPPAVIFVTAFSEHAVRAFDVHALDYLLKPVTSNRLRESVERFRKSKRVVSEPVANHLIPLGTTGRFVSSEEVLYIEAANQNTEVVLADGQRHHLRQSIRQWTEELPSPPFVKLERSLIVNLSKIVSVTYATRSAQLYLGISPEVLHIGSKAAQRLRGALPSAQSKDD